MLESTVENAALGVPAAYYSQCVQKYIHICIYKTQYCVIFPQREKNWSCFIITQGRKMQRSHPCFHLAQFPLLPGGAEHFLSPWSWDMCQGGHSTDPGNGEVRFKLFSYRCSQRLKNIQSLTKISSLLLVVTLKGDHRITEPFELERTF